MKHTPFLIVSLLLTLAVPAEATHFVSGSTGADGAFAPTVSTTLTVPESGVFNFTTVNIGVTVTFTKNAKNTPVVILATGDVNMTGTIRVSGSNYSTQIPGKGGPGGFDGGYGGVSGRDAGAGQGPGGGGGGRFQSASYNYGGGAGYRTAGGAGSGPLAGAGGSVYGTERLIPLIGGSGGGGGTSAYATSTGYGGGGGGGTILIASSGSIIFGGYAAARIEAKGGCSYSLYGGGSGGAIRLVANSITGAPAAIDVAGCQNGGMGRVRLEAHTFDGAIAGNPDYSYGAPGSVFPASAPSLRIAFIAGVAAPVQPTGSYQTPDVTLPTTTANPATVGLEAANIPVGTVIAVTVTPQWGVASTTSSAPLSGTQAASTATASVTLPTTDPAILTATATFTLASWEGFPRPLYAGEEVTRVRVAASYGGPSRVTYLTASGKEAPADQMAWWPVFSSE